WRNPRRRLRETVRPGGRSIGSERGGSHRPKCDQKRTGPGSSAHMVSKHSTAVPAFCAPGIHGASMEIRRSIGQAGKLTRAAENIEQHLFRKLSGGGVLLAGMVAGDQDRVVRRNPIFAVVPERIRRSAGDDRSRF